MSARNRWTPISQDSDPAARDRRLALVERDVLLRATGAPCPRCGGRARSAAGEGCSCPSGVERLVARCLDRAVAVRDAS